MSSFLLHIHCNTLYHLYIHSARFKLELVNGALLICYRATQSWINSTIELTLLTSTSSSAVSEKLCVCPDCNHTTLLQTTIADMYVHQILVQQLYTMHMLLCSRVVVKSVVSAAAFEHELYIFVDRPACN